ncbi:MAG: radical SAM protein [bacterium]
MAGKLKEIKLSTVCRHLPKRLVLEPTTRCNLSCLFCARNDPEMISHGQGDMSVDLLEEILRPLAGVNAIGIGGLGEPLLHPRIDEIVKLSKRSARRVTLNTNGTLLRELADKLAGLGLDSISFSIDGGDRRTFEALRGYSLDKLLESVKGFALESSIPLIAYAVLSGRNYRSLLKLPRLLRRQEIPHLIAVNYQRYNPLSSRAEAGLAMDDSLFPGWREEMERECRKYGFACTDTSNPPLIEKSICSAPFLMPALNYRGFLTPCCRRYACELADCGPAGFIAAWNSLGMWYFRRRIIEGNYPEACSRICGFSPP